MTPDQLRALAELFEQSYPPPSIMMSLDEYPVAMSTHLMAKHLRTLADTMPQPDPGYPHISDFAELARVMQAAVPDLPLLRDSNGDRIQGRLSAAILRAGYHK